MESLAAGPSNSIESSNSGPSTSSSSGPAAFDSSRSEPEDSQEPSQEVNIRVASLLSRLKSPRPSDFTQNVLIRVCNHEKRPFCCKKKTGIMGTFFSIIGMFLENCLKA